MPTPRLEPFGGTVAYSANGSITKELSPTPYTITSMVLVVRANVTTGATPGTYNDPWDRLISTLTLSARGKTFFSFRDLRVLQHFNRYYLGPAAGKRPDAVAANQTGVKRQFIYRIHFGVRPFKIGPDGKLQYDPWDLTAGIPATSKGQMTLTGTFGPANAPGSGWTVNDASFDVYVYGVQGEPGDPPSAYLPQAIPVWMVDQPSVTSTSTTFGSSASVPAGNWWHSGLIAVYRGANAPRDDQTLNSLRLFNQLQNREIFRFGGQTGIPDDYKAAELLTQTDLSLMAPISEDLGGTVGSLAITPVTDVGLVYLPLYKWVQHKGGNSLWGADLRGIGSGDLQLQYGVSNATSVTLNIFYRKYELLTDHPANAGV